jgi:hypothetical protein
MGLKVRKERYYPLSFINQRNRVVSPTKVIERVKQLLSQGEHRITKDRSILREHLAQPHLEIQTLRMRIKSNNNRQVQCVFKYYSLSYKIQPRKLNFNITVSKCLSLSIQAKKVRDLLITATCLDNFRLLLSQVNKTFYSEIIIKTP